ncbi:MAG: hypothetical protein O3C40_37260 [Planctomycetota bacterium]|nr:hypothetical protein [Planctomycetota bacterium]
MRDGIVLRADLYLPDSGGPWPTLLERTPYDKQNCPEIMIKSPEYFCSRGYAIEILLKSPN